MSAGDWIDDGVRFSCNRCGSCCTGPAGDVACSPDEIAAMARVLGLLPFEFKARYVVELQGGSGIRQLEREPGSFDCVFLEREGGLARCRVHEARPTQCRTWPFWPSYLARANDFAALAEHCVGVRRGLEGVGLLHTREEVLRAAAATPSGLVSHHDVEDDGGRNGFS